jgi:hypothetical protein
VTPSGTALERFWAPATRAWPVALAAGLGSLALYVATLSQLVYSADPAEFQTMAATGGIAHAGYPTYVLMLQAFGALPLGTLAWRANLFTAICGALAIAALAYTAQRWTGRRLASLAAAGAFAMAITTWNEATLAGVHAWTLALDGALLLIALRYAWRPSVGLAALAGGAFGVGLTGHLTVLGLGLPLLLALLIGLRSVSRRAAHVSLAALGLVVGLSPFAYTLAVDRPEQPMNYLHDTLEPGEAPFAVERPDLGQRVARLQWLLSGKQYLEARQNDLGTYVHRAVHVASVVAMNDLPFLTLLLALAGFVALCRTRGVPRLLVLAWFVPALVLAHIGGSEQTIHYFFQPCTWMLSLGLAIAIAGLQQRGRAWALAAAVVVLGTPLVRLCVAEPPGPLDRYAMWRRVWCMAPFEWSPFREDRRWDDYGRGVMRQLPARAVILGGRWTECETLRYFVHGEVLRPDVEVWYAGLRAPRFGRMVREAQRSGRPVYFTRLPEEAVLEGASFEMVWSSGLQQLWRLHPAAP